MTFSYVYCLKSFPIPKAEFYKLLHGAEVSGDYGIGKTIDIQKIPEIYELSLALSLESFITLFITDLRTPRFPIHRDGLQGSERVASLNIPLVNCDGRTRTQFYQPKQSGSLETYSFANGEFVCDETQMKLDRSYSLSDLAETPYLIRSNEWHSVERFDFFETRLMLSWRFKKGESWQQIYDRVYSNFSLFPAPALVG